MPTSVVVSAQTMRLRNEALIGIAGGGVPKCVCCGEKRKWALTIDHINNGGTAERKKYNSGSTYRLVRKEYKQTGIWNREKYQILCGTCNLGKRITYSTCPHKEEKIMTPQFVEAVKSYVKVFAATVLTLFIANGADVFSVDFSDLKTYISSGIAAVLPLIITALDPNDDRFGVNSD